MLTRRITITSSRSSSCTHPAPGTFACPSRQTLFLQSVTYTGTNVSDATGNMFHATPDPIGTGPIHIPA